MVNLKVICQICGETDTIETTALTSWTCQNVNELLGHEKECDWEFWLCPKCFDIVYKDDQDSEKAMEILEESLGLKKVKK